MSYSRVGITWPEGDVAGAVCRQLISENGVRIVPWLPMAWESSEAIAQLVAECDVLLHSIGVDAADDEDAACQQEWRLSQLLVAAGELSHPPRILALVAADVTAASDSAQTRCATQLQSWAGAHLMRSSALLVVHGRAVRAGAVDGRLPLDDLAEQVAAVIRQPWSRFEHVDIPYAMHGQVAGDSRTSISSRAA